MKILPFACISIGAILVCFALGMIYDQLFRLWRRRQDRLSRSRPLANLKLMLGMIFLLLCWRAGAQTNSPPPLPQPSFINLNFLTNLPSVGDFTQATAGFSTGPLLRNGSIENEEKGDLFINTNYVFSLSAQMAPSASVVDSLSLHGGYRKAWQSAQLMVQVLGRRTWTTTPSGITPSWQGGINIDADFLPTTGGKIMVGTSFRLLTAYHGNIFKTPLQFEFVPARISILF